jgi:nicotinate-nucleotide adenylyltransferase
MRIGVFGGTFDPPHLAHLVLAEEARYQLNLERVHWVLTPVSPLNPGMHLSTWEKRLELLESALIGNPHFEVSRVEIDRPAPHYTFETLGIIGEIFAQEEIVFLMGGDSLRDLPKWKNPQKLLANCQELGVMRRPGDKINMSKLESAIPGVNAKVKWVSAPLLEISGSQIRARLRVGEPVRYFLPERVYEIILAERLYQD